MTTYTVTRTILSQGVKVTIDYVSAVSGMDDDASIRATVSYTVRTDRGFGDDIAYEYARIGYDRNGVPLDPVLIDVWINGQ